MTPPISSTLILLVMSSTVVLSKPLSLSVGFRPSDSFSSISAGPGLGGAPVLVDTSSHMMDHRGRSNRDDELTISVRNNNNNPDFGGVRREHLPIIRPATNVQYGGRDEEGIDFLNIMLRKMRFLLSTLEGTDVNLSIDGGGLRRLEGGGGSWRTSDVNIQISKAPSPYSAIMSSTGLGGRSVDYSQVLDHSSIIIPSDFNTRNEQQEDDLPVIRSATNVQGRKLMPVIRPATNVY